MTKLLVIINILLVFAILGAAFFWHPQPEEAPLPGTHAAKLGRDASDPQAAGSRPAAELGTGGTAQSGTPPRLGTASQ